MIFWWKFSIIIIVNTTKIAIITHDQSMKECNHLTIFTNDIDIDNQIETFAMTNIFLMSNMIFIMMNKKQIYLRFIKKITIYFEEIMRLDLALNVAEKSFQRSSHRYIHELSNCYSSYSVFQETVSSISAADINSKNWAMRSRNSHSLNLCSRWNFRQWSSRHNCQRNHWLKTIRSRLIDFRHCQFEDTHFSDQKWNSHSRKDWMNWDMKNYHHSKNHSSNHQKAHQECSQKVQKNDTIRERDHRSSSNK
jgi:hypothetical protein